MPQPHAETGLPKLKFITLEHDPAMTRNISGIKKALHFHVRL